MMTKIKSSLDKLCLLLEVVRVWCESFSCEQHYFLEKKPAQGADQGIEIFRINPV